MTSTGAALNDFDRDPEHDFDRDDEMVGCLPQFWHRPSKPVPVISVEEARAKAEEARLEARRKRVYALYAHIYFRHETKEYWDVTNKDLVRRNPDPEFEKLMAIHRQLPHPHPPLFDPQPPVTIRESWPVPAQLPSGYDAWGWLGDLAHSLSPIQMLRRIWVALGWLLVGFAHLAAYCIPWIGLAMFIAYPTDGLEKQLPGLVGLGASLGMLAMFVGIALLIAGLVLTLVGSVGAYMVDPQGKHQIGVLRPASKFFGRRLFVSRRTQ
jgi:hypothetical protein